MTGTLASLIAEGTTVDGGVSGDCELQVDGVVHGDVAVTHLSVGEVGKVEGASKAESVEVRGRVLGSISAKQVKLLAGCRVEGDISHEQLIIEPGAIFEGRSLRLERPVAAIVSSTKSEATDRNLALGTAPDFSSCGSDENLSAGPDPEGAR
jgi:cytoskeletal protein CcmA (bactofilin family)